MRVSVVAGVFPSRAALEAYVEETYADDGTPRSAFLDELGRVVGPADLIEIHFAERATRDLAGLLAGCSWASEYADAAARDWPGDLAVNAVLLGIDLGASTPSLPPLHDPAPPGPGDPRHVRGPAHEVRFVGAYDVAASYGARGRR